MKKATKLLIILDSFLNIAGVISSYVLFILGVKNESVLFVSIAIFLYLVSKRSN